jgi:Tfp pilus assembly protein PilN
MALHINLYHEVEKQKAIDRRDPLKLGLIGLAGIALCFAGYFLYQVSVQSGLKSDLSRLQGESARLQAKADIARAKEEELSGTIKVSDTLVNRIEGRFYWAPVLEALTQIVPREVQLTRVAGEVTGDQLKRCTLTIDGIAAGAEPRTTAEELRKSFSETFGAGYKNVSSAFKVLEDGKENATLDGQSLPTALFSISVQLQIGEAPPAESTDSEELKKS